VINRALAKALGKGGLAGTAMAAAALGLRSLNVNPWLAAPIAAVVYFGALYLVGGVDMTQINRLTDGIKNRLARRRAA